MRVTPGSRLAFLIALGGVLCDGDGGGGGGDDAIRKAQFERDSAIAEQQKLQKQLDAMKGQLLTDEDRKLFDKLKTDQAKAEEDKKRAEGKFDELRSQLLEKHTGEVKTLTERAEAAEKRLRDTLISREFAGATGLFSGAAESKTVLTHDIAESYFKPFVDLAEDGKSVVVKNAQGQIVLDPKTGKPMAFADALVEVINTLPNKNNILRGSGKTGSGNSGGGNGGSNDTVDFSNLTPTQMRDPKIIAEAKRRTAAAGGIVNGEAFERIGSKAS